MTTPPLPAFAAWLHTLGEDALSLAHVLESPDEPAPFRLASAEALSYLLRAADLIPEGIEPLGYLEVAFAFRAVAKRALGEGLELAESGLEGRVPRLAAEAGLVVEFLGDDIDAFQELLASPAALSRAGRPAAELLDDAALRAATLEHVRAWVELYRAPELEPGDEELVKLRSFFRTRLRRAS